MLIFQSTQSSRKPCTEQSPKESDDTRCCTNTICPPEDENNSARNKFIKIKICALNC